VGCTIDVDVAVDVMLMCVLKRSFYLHCGSYFVAFVDGDGDGDGDGLVWSGLGLLLVFSYKNQKQSTDSRVFLGRVLPGQPHSQCDAKYKSA